MKSRIAYHNGDPTQGETMTPGEIRSIAESRTGQPVSYAAIHLWCKAGKLHPVSIGQPIGPHGGQMKLFARDEVMQFLAERRAKGNKRAKRKTKIKKGAVTS
jgi:hypothetical protein